MGFVQSCRTMEIPDLGSPDEGGATCFKNFLTEIGFEVVDWIHLSQNRGKWEAFMNILMTYCVSY